MLALLMLPLAALVYVTVIVALLEFWSPSRELPAFLIADSVTALFVACYWMMLWHSTVVWTRRRRIWTVASGLAALAFGLGVGQAMSHVDAALGVFIGGAAAILIWPVLTVLVWRETADERATRLRAAGATAIVCPACGYNLTGLKQTTCPECGASYTINELLAAQPSCEIERLEQA